MINVVLFFHALLAIIGVGFYLIYSLWFARASQHPGHLEFALRGVKFMHDYVANPARSCC